MAAPPPPPPPPAPAPTATTISNTGSKAPGDLLSAIQTGKTLKKTETVNKSSGTGGSSASSSSPQLGGLFAGGFPSLKKTGLKGASTLPPAAAKNAPQAQVAPKRAPAALTQAKQTAPTAVYPKYLAKYDFKASKASDLSIVRGDIVEVLEKRDSGWWRCKIVSGGAVGAQGLTPGNYLVVLVQVKAKFKYNAARSDELNFEVGDVIDVRKKGKNWWIGQLNGNVGVFPLNYVTILPTPQ